MLDTVLNDPSTRLSPEPPFRNALSSLTVQRKRHSKEGEPRFHQQTVLG